MLDAVSDVNTSEQPTLSRRLRENRETTETTARGSPPRQLLSAVKTVEKPYQYQDCINVAYLLNI